MHDACSATKRRLKAKRGPLSRFLLSLCGRAKWGALCPVTRIDHSHSISRGACGLRRLAFRPPIDWRRGARGRCRPRRRARVPPSASHHAHRSSRGPSDEFLSSPSGRPDRIGPLRSPLRRPAWVHVHGDHRTGPEFRPRGVLMGGEGAGAWWRDGMTRKPTWEREGRWGDDNPRSITCLLPPHPPHTRIDPQSAAADAEAGQGQPWTARPR